MEAEFFFLGTLAEFNAEMQAAEETIHIKPRIVKADAALLVIHLHTDPRQTKAHDLEQFIDRLEAGCPPPSRSQFESIGQGVVTVVQLTRSTGVITCRVTVKIEGHRTLEKRWKRLYDWLEKQRRLFPSDPATAVHPTRDPPIQGAQPMACFTPEQYRLMTEGLLAAVAETPKVRQYPRSQIAGKLRNINRITAEQSDMDKVVYDVLQEIQANSLCLELVQTAHAWNPFEPNLEALNRQFVGIKTVEPEQERELERLLTITKEQFLNPILFAQRFGAIRYRVCRIEIGAKDAQQRQPLATGFLVGPDVVLTNHHVIEPVLEDKVKAQQFVFGLDRVELDGVETYGPTYGLNTPSERANWLLAMNNRLDYALLRLDGPAGDRPIVGGTNDPAAAKRGWLALSAKGAQELVNGAPLLIFQHPDGLPLRIDIRWVNTVAATRVTYTTNTMPGSSGSPCFDRELRLSALHQGAAGALNEGIPVAAILADLEQKGLQDKVAVE